MQAVLVGLKHTYNDLIVRNRESYGEGGRKHQKTPS